MYAQRGDQLYVNLYVASSAEIKMDNGRTVQVTQETRYPWEGRVKMTVKPDQPGKLALNVRIPGWARNEPVPGDLYRFADQASAAPSVKVNGKPVGMTLTKGYVTIDRPWKAGDTVELDLPMPVRRVAANTEVAADRGRVALQRGPLVYTAEWADNPNGKVRNLMLPDTATLTAEYDPKLLKGVTVLKGRAVALQAGADGSVQKTVQPFTAIPYYAWANRGRGQMLVWLPNSETSAKPAAWPTSTTAQITVSGNSRKNPGIISMTARIRRVGRPGGLLRLVAKNGSARWVQMTFAKPATVANASIGSTTPATAASVPASWKLLSRWRGVEASGKAPTAGTESVQRADLPSGDHDGPPHRAAGATERLHRHPGVEGEVDLVARFRLRSLSELFERLHLSARRTRVDRHDAERHAFEEGIDLTRGDQRRRGIYQYDIALRPGRARQHRIGDLQIPRQVAAIQIFGRAVIAKSAGSSMRGPRLAVADFQATRSQAWWISSRPSEPWTTKPPEPEIGGRAGHQFGGVDGRRRPVAVRAGLVSGPRRLKTVRSLEFHPHVLGVLRRGVRRSEQEADADLADGAGSELGRHRDRYAPGSSRSALPHGS